MQDFIERLSTEHKMLVILKARLYGGSWQAMENDLKNRLSGKPYIFKLATRINDDIDRIQQLKNFENSNGVDLAEYIDLEQ